MRAESPNERPTAVLSDQLSARLLPAMSKYGRPQKFEIQYYALADITLLHFDVHTYTCCARWYPRDRELNTTAIAMSSYSVVHHVYHGTSNRRDRELKYSSQPIAKDQASRTPKRGSLTVTLLFADHLRRSSLYDSTVDTLAQQLCEGVLVEKDDTAVAKHQTGWQSKTQGL